MTSGCLVFYSLQPCWKPGVSHHTSLGLWDHACHSCFTGPLEVGPVCTTIWYNWCCRPFFHPQLNKQLLSLQVPKPNSYFRASRPQVMSLSNSKLPLRCASCWSWVTRKRLGASLSRVWYLLWLVSFPLHHLAPVRDTVRQGFLSFQVRNCSHLGFLSDLVDPRWKQLH